MTPTKFSRFPKPRVMTAARKGDETVSAAIERHEAPAADMPTKPRRKAASKPKRVTALQRAALRLEAARAPVYAVRGRVADAFLSTVSPLALALAMPTDYPWLRRRLFAPEVYRLDPFRKRTVVLA